jgi:uncharacterized protein YndB with AHSA1/START domain
MTTNKDFKRLVRARMTKTGESYTSARLRLLQKQPSTVAAPTPDYAKLAGMSDASIKAHTGCNWERWVWALDRVKAHDWPHRAIAEYVQEKYKVPDWWTQWVTTGYERIKDLRAIGQRRGGAFEVNKSKTFAAPVGRLYRAWTDARTRRRWLPEVTFTVRTAKPSQTLRVTWADGSSVEVYFVSKGARKSTVTVQHRKLPDQAAADRQRQFWADRFTALAELLEPARRSA